MGHCISTNRLESVERRVTTLNNRLDTHVLECGVRIGNLERDIQMVKGKTRVTDQLVQMHAQHIDSLSGRILRETM